MISLIIVINYTDFLICYENRSYLGKTGKKNVFIGEAIPKEINLLRITVREKEITRNDQSSCNTSFGLKNMNFEGNMSLINCPNGVCKGTFLLLHFPDVSNCPQHTSPLLNII